MLRSADPLRVPKDQSNLGELSRRELQSAARRMYPGRAHAIERELQNQRLEEPRFRNRRLGRTLSKLILDPCQPIVMERHEWRLWVSSRHSSPNQATVALRPEAVTQFEAMTLAVTYAHIRSRIIQLVKYTKILGLSLFLPM